MEQVAAQIERDFDRLKVNSLTMRAEPPGNRKERLRRLKRWIHANLDPLTEAAKADLNKPALEFRAIEVLCVLNEIRTALRHMEDWATARPVNAPISLIGTKSEIRYEPKGVCLILAPWNFPFVLAVSPLVSALAAGNSVVIKPAESAPRMSSEIARMVSEVFDPAVVSVIEGGIDTSGQLLELPFDHIFFTGSPHVARIVMRAAAAHLTPVTLELGGKSPCIVTRSAKLDEAAKRIVASKFANAGQTCVAPDYLLVDSSIMDALIGRVIFHIHTGFSDTDKLPFIVSEKHYARLQKLVDDSIMDGALAVCGGKGDAGSRCFQPTVLTNVPAGSAIMEEEIFGPILPVLTYTSLEDAIRTINSKPKPLALYIFSGSGSEKERIIRKTSSGGVCVNDCAIQFFHPGLPFGGIGNSGSGRAHGQAGFVTFSNEKSVMNQRHGLTSVSFLYPPYTARKEKLLAKFMKLFYR
jgi:aldehyde dehydrogenase (NAD+)